MINYKLCVLHYVAIQYVFRFIGMYMYYVHVCTFIMYMCVHLLCTCVYMYYVHVCTFIMYMCVPVVLCVCSPISMY